MKNKTIYFVIIMLMISIISYGCASIIYIENEDINNAVNFEYVKCFKNNNNNDF